MGSLNKVQLIGNLGADPEERSLNSGKSVVNMRIATSEQWKDRDGNRQERTEWHQVVSFNEGLNKVIMDYVRKGSKIYVAGKLQTRKWTDQKGDDRYSTEIVLQAYDAELILLDGKRDDDGGGRSSGRGGGRQQARQDDFGYEEPERERGRDEGRRPQPAAFDTDLDDDVPF